MRRRTNQPDTPITRAPAGERPNNPQADPNWDPIAIEWFESLFESGQSFFYERSDIAQARYVAEVMSRNLSQGQRVSGQLFASVISAASELLTTEGARRRLGVELTKSPSADMDAGLDELLNSYRDE
ncbi:hypothetical protein [Streptomyces sp. B1I3]|uniref:phage terminase small subunit n=1 Tax=Streptomyces sp. B1I3 TaxID=3042264 RepID=UPI00277D774A|nr:hypothetical protein [Streptomyces sp. B1I3]MDQ0793680.1 hypothetical protein [Streptomyces sp. B1I3]